MRIFGIGSHYVTLNSATKKSSSMSMSTVYTVLSSFHVVFISLRLLTAAIIHEVLQTFTGLVVLIFLWPCLSVDGMEAFYYVHDCRREAYHQKMLSLAEESYRTVSFISNFFKHFQAKPDCQNVHWLLKICTNFVPLFGHAFYFSELKFEWNHQSLELVHLKSTDSPGHIESIYDVLCKNWLQRVYKNWLIYNNEMYCDTEHA